MKTVKDGDNSVQEYGVESGSSERREASIALQAYLDARADEDWGTACSLLAKKPMEQLERLQAAAAKQGKKLEGCPATMALLREGEARAEEQSTITEVLSFRGGGDISGDPSYLLYVAPPGNTLFSMPMYFEGGDLEGRACQGSGTPGRLSLGNATTSEEQTDEPKALLLRPPDRCDRDPRHSGSGNRPKSPSRATCG